MGKPDGGQVGRRIPALRVANVKAHIVKYTFGGAISSFVDLTARGKAAASARVYSF